MVLHQIKKETLISLRDGDYHASEFHHVTARHNELSMKQLFDDHCTHLTMPIYVCIYACIYKYIYAQFRNTAELINTAEGLFCSYTILIP